MTDFVATIHVQDGQSVWRATEVPHLTADSLYRFEPVPDPVVPRAELRRVTNAEWRQGLAGKALTARELASLNRVCRTAGLSPLPDELRYSQWGVHLEACNNEADARGWLVCLMPPRDPHHGERFSWAIAADEHRKLLQSLIASGEIQARMAGTLVPAPPGRIALDHLVLTRDALEQFAGRLAIAVEDKLPHFVTSAHPKEVPAELLALPDEARVSYEHNIAGQRGSGITNAASYRNEIRGTIARQTEGYYTLNEAAQVLSDSRPGLDPMETLRRLRLAHSKGELTIHQGGSRFPLELGETVREFMDTVEAGKLDAWLCAAVGYGFPWAEHSRPASLHEVTDSLMPLELGTPKRWTDERLAELRAYRAAHGTKAAAERAGISEARVRELLPGDKPGPQGYSAFSHR